MVRGFETVIGWTVTSSETRGSSVCVECSFMLDCPIVSSDSVTVRVPLSVENGEIFASVVT